MRRADLAETVRHRFGGLARLSEARNRGRKVWAIACPTHQAGVHMYTLTDGTPCWDWASRLNDLARKLEGAP